MIAKQPTIKAIETAYNGYLFRSRLEARWAVFFDAADIGYAYEPEGFDLDGLHYLPDFWLPDLQAWVEIKPGSYRRGWYRWDEEGHKYVAPKDAPAKALDVPDGFYEDLTKLHRLVDATGCPGFMLFDDIEPLGFRGEHEIVGSNKIWWPANRNPWNRESGHDDGCCEWAQCPLCGKIGFAQHGQHQSCNCRCNNGFDMPASRKGNCRRCSQCGASEWPDTTTPHRPWMSSDTAKLIEAYTAARSARFEHGQTPATLPRRKAK
jgi:hypothetical protein